MRKTRTISTEVYVGYVDVEVDVEDIQSEIFEGLDIKKLVDTLEHFGDAGAGYGTPQHIAWEFYWQLKEHLS